MRGVFSLMSVITCKLAVRQQSSYWLQPGVIDWVSILINISGNIPVLCYAGRGCGCAVRPRSSYHHHYFERTHFLGPGRTNNTSPASACQGLADGADILLAGMLWLTERGEAGLTALHLNRIVGTLPPSLPPWPD